MGNECVALEEVAYRDQFSKGKPERQSRVNAELQRWCQNQQEGPAG